MPRKTTRGAQGGGTIRQRKDGRWEGRVTIGHDPGTGRQVQRSVYGSTQQDVRKKLTTLINTVDEGKYKKPNKMTLGQWLDIWQREYLGNVKPRTKESYECQIKNHIRPGLGSVRLDRLDQHTIQRFCNRLDGLSPKSVKIVHGVLHKALGQAVSAGYIQFNPADGCTLPRVERKELTALDDDATKRFIDAIKGHQYESVFLFALFTGARQGEILGLTWNAVDFKSGTLTINKQLQKTTTGGSVYTLVSTKNGKGRTITPAPYVMALLKRERAKQIQSRFKAGRSWANDDNLVFTDEMGRHLMPHTVYHNFKRVVESIGIPSARFHDLRHSYAVAAIRSGDDIKTVQGNLGHATASFTLDTYAHFTDQMKRDSAARMEEHIKAVTNL